MKNLLIMLFLLFTSILAHAQSSYIEICKPQWDKEVPVVIENVYIENSVAFDDLNRIMLEAGYIKNCSSFKVSMATGKFTFQMADTSKSANLECFLHLYSFNNMARLSKINNNFEYPVLKDFVDVEKCSELAKTDNLLKDLFLSEKIK